MAQNVVIGGGTGFVGQALCKLLKSRGCAVTMISRQRKPPEQISWGFIRDKGLPSGTDAVVNLSGAPVVDPLKRFSIDEYKQEVRNSRIHTTKWLTRAIADAAVKPKVWISASGVGFYPTSETAEYDEDSPGGIDEYFATLVKEWEESAELPERCADVRKAVVRIGAVLGNGGGVIKNVKLPFLMGVGGAYGSGKQFFPWVHIEDVAGIFNHIIATENLSGVFNAVSPNVATNQEFANEFALGAILLGAKVGETIRKGIIDAEIYEDNEKTLMVGEVSAMIGSMLWQLIATFLKMPVSGTHSIVGACVGFSLVAMGVEGVNWGQLGKIIASWFISPVLAGAMAGIFYWFLRRLIFLKEDPVPPGLIAMPILYAATLMINTFSVLHSGSEILQFDKIPLWAQFIIPMAIAAVVYIGVRVIYVPRMVRSIEWERRKQATEITWKNKSDENQTMAKKVIMPPTLETISEADLSYESETKTLMNGHTGNGIGAGDAPMKENHVNDKCPSSPKKNGSKNSLGDIKSMMWQSNQIMAEERKAEGRAPRSQSVGDHHVRIPALLQLEKQVLKSRVPEPTVQELKATIRKNFSEPTMVNLAERSGSDFYEVHINRQRRAVTIQRKKRTRSTSGHSESSYTRVQDGQLSSTNDIGDSIDVILEGKHPDQLEEPFDESEDEGTGLIMKSSEDVMVLASDQKSYSGAIEEGFRKLSTCPLPDIIEIKVSGNANDDCEVGDIDKAIIVEEDKEDRVEVKQIFRFLQILTACFGSFAHGGNDVSNAIGPLIALYLIYMDGTANQAASTPIWLLLYGGVGICAGLWVWGRRVIKTMGEDLTSLTPSRGFSIELMSAVTVLGASNAGIPVSTTHCKVGAVVAVGYVRSRQAVDWKIFRNIVLAWFVTVPVSGGLSAVVFLILRSVIEL